MAVYHACISPEEEYLYSNTKAVISRFEQMYMKNRKEWMEAILFEDDTSEKYLDAIKNISYYTNKKKN
jgi:hypothetical protein